MDGWILGSLLLATRSSSFGRAAKRIDRLATASVRVLDQNVSIANGSAKSLPVFAGRPPTPSAEDVFRRDNPLTAATDVVGTVASSSRPRRRRGDQHDGVRCAI